MPSQRTQLLRSPAPPATAACALAKFPALKPDIVLLDIEMPEMDGLETVRELRKIDARVPIIMFSTLTEHGAAATLEALALGATDYVTKPSNRNMAATLEAVSRELIPRIHALCHFPEVPILRSAPKLPAIPPRSCEAALAVARCRWWRLEFLPAVRTRWLGFCRRCPRTFPVPVCHRAAYAANFHVAAGGAPLGEVGVAGAGVRLRRTAHAWLRRDRSGRFSHGGAAGGWSRSAKNASGPEGKFLPSVGRCAFSARSPASTARERWP